MLRLCFSMFLLLAPLVNCSTPQATDAAGAQRPLNSPEKENISSALVRPWQEGNVALSFAKLTYES
jgi:hypothetical protein